VIPCETNALGVKGCGEAGAIAAPPAVINAVADALREHDQNAIEMPVTPETIWRAIHRGE
jgi:carbon-monoxide dehydrogenase large subunit